VKTLAQTHTKASFFLTGRFYRNTSFANTIKHLKKQHQYLGSHSNEHLLYCDWTKRDSLLITYDQFTSDLQQSYSTVKQFGINKTSAHYFLPPYEWYNDTIAIWTNNLGLQLVNYTPGTLSHADYTTPDEKNYRSSETIYQSIITYEQQHPSGLNGFILLMHIGTDPNRTDKFYNHLPQLIQWLKMKGYNLVTIDKLLQPY
jgi:peptidoglycan/xylan/chitin deacetylase (PgdA/CDA1 family)